MLLVHTEVSEEKCQCLCEFVWNFYACSYPKEGITETVLAVMFLGWMVSWDRQGKHMNNCSPCCTLELGLLCFTKCCFFPPHFQRQRGGHICNCCVYNITPRLGWWQTLCWTVKDPKFRNNSCQCLTCVVSITNLLGVSSHRAFHLVPVLLVDRPVPSCTSFLPFSSLYCCFSILSSLYCTACPRPYWVLSG